MEGTEIFMRELIIFNSIMIGIVVGILILLKKVCKTDKSRRIALIIIPIATVLCHYSSLLYHHFNDNTAMQFLRGNPNLVLPIYPCNVVMWLALVLGLIKKDSALKKFLTDYVFWFGFPAAIVGMFANVDYFRDPTFLNYDVTKGIVAHAIMLLNVLALPTLGLVKIRLEKNLLNIFGSIVMMYFVGLYCNLLFTVISSAETAYNVNSMFIIHSPFPEIEFLRYPIISLCAIIIYSLIFHIAELFVFKKGGRWYNRMSKYFKDKSKFADCDGANVEK